MLAHVCRSSKHSASAVLAAALAVLLAGLCSEVQCTGQARARAHDTQHGRLHALLTQAQPHAHTDVTVDEFLRGCNFSAAEYQKWPRAPKWHTASRACDILGRFDALLVMGDSLTRQVLPALPCCCAPLQAGNGTRAAGVQLYEGLLQLLREDLATGVLRDDLPPEHAAFCTCNEFHKNCRVFTEAWPASLTWVDGAPLVRTLARPQLLGHTRHPCPAKHRLACGRCRGRSRHAPALRPSPCSSSTSTWTGTWSRPAWTTWR